MITNEVHWYQKLFKLYCVTCFVNYHPIIFFFFKFKINFWNTLTVLTQLSNYYGIARFIFIIMLRISLWVCAQHITATNLPPSNPSLLQNLLHTYFFIYQVFSIFRITNALTYFSPIISYKNLIFNYQYTYSLQL